ARFHLLEPIDGNERFTGIAQQRLQSLDETRHVRHGTARSSLHGLDVPGMRHDGAYLAFLRQQRDRLRTREAHAHETAKMILAPRIAVEQQHVPAARRHQLEKLCLALWVQLQHGPRSEERRVGKERPPRGPTSTYR